MKILHLTLTHHWFDEIAAGRKTTEYREKTHRWHERIIRANPSVVVFHRGYTKKTLSAHVRHIDEGPCPYPDWPDTYYRIHFTVPALCAPASSTPAPRG